MSAPVPTRRVLDTSALMSGRPFGGELFTTEEVLRELEQRDALTPQLETFLAVKVHVISPTQPSLAAIRARSEGTGDVRRLSPTDVGLLAIAAQLGATIVTDDYSIQNVAQSMGLPYEKVLERGISSVIRWRYKCTGCGKPYDEWHDPCPICGASLRTSRR